MNSMLAKWSRAPYSAYAASIVRRTLEEINLCPKPQGKVPRASLADGRKQNVWQLWLQGWADTPPMVSSARALNEKANPQLDFHYLNLEEASELVGLNPKVKELYEQGAIRPAGMADLLRLLIVEQMGGIWLDATVVTSPSFGRLTADTPNFFLINGRQWDKIAPRHHSVTTWAFGASPGNPFVGNWAQLLEQHFLRNGQLHYFDSFFCATALIRRGQLPLSDLGRDESLQLFEGGKKLMNAWLRNSNFDSLRDTYFAFPLHKLSYKMGSRDLKNLLQVLDQLANELPK